MKRKLTGRSPKAEKSYHSANFLNSPAARPLRILSEFLEPFNRLRKHGIRDTIVFFGSARLKSRKDALKQHKQFVARSKNKNKLSQTRKSQIDEAKTALEMSRYYEDAVQLARMLTRWSKRLYHLNRFVVCSGGGPGIMEAANKGARLAGGRSVGLNISLPFEQSANPYVTKELSFEFHYFFMRKFWFVYLAKALIIFPGGFGTLDEFMEVLTLSQTSKIKKKITVVLYGSDYWKRVIDFPFMLKQGVVSKSDFKLFTYADSPKEAYEYLVKELRKNYPEETSLANGA